MQVPIHDCDVCLISWEQITKELREHHAGSVLAKFGFWRIIIDEAQVLQINYGEDGDMLNDLWRRKMWLLSGADAACFYAATRAASLKLGMPPELLSVDAGTPIQQSFFELQQYLKILTCEPLYHNMTWRALCWKPFHNLQPMGLNVAKCEPCSFLHLWLLSHLEREYSIRSCKR